MILAILFHFLCTQHVSDINISIIRSLRIAVELPHPSFCPVKTEDLALVSSLTSSTFVASHKHIPRSVSGPLEHDSTAKMRQCE